VRFGLTEARVEDGNAQGLEDQAECADTPDDHGKAGAPNGKQELGEPSELLEAVVHRVDSQGLDVDAVDGVVEQPVDYQLRIGLGLAAGCDVREKRAPVEVAAAIRSGRLR